MSSLPALSLTTARLHLRELKAEDWQPVLAYQSKAAYLRYYPWYSRTKEDVTLFLARFISWQQEQPRTKFQVGITLPHSGRLIGLCGIRKKEHAAPEAEIGYELDPGYWGQGYATEAAQAMLTLGFTQLRVHRIWATCVPENFASVRVLKKLGLRPEGCLREHRWMKDRWWDTLIFGILEKEWHSRRH